jgi:hypothetical protein
VAGFEHLQLSLIDYNTPYIMGTAQPSFIHNNEEGIPVLISPNPVHNEFTVLWNCDEYNWEIVSLQGNLLMKGKAGNEPERIDVSLFRPGVYIIGLKSSQNNYIAVKKFIKE